MGMKYMCPFCNTKLSRKEMQFHVGIPLCMQQRRADAKTVEIKGGFKPLAVSGLKYAYFGKRGIQKLIDAALSHGYGDPPLDLESFVDHSEEEVK